MRLKGTPSHEVRTAVLPLCKWISSALLRCIAMIEYRCRAVQFQKLMSTCISSLKRPLKGHCSKGGNKDRNKIRRLPSMEKIKATPVRIQSPRMMISWCISDTITSVEYETLDCTVCRGLTLTMRDLYTTKILGGDQSI